MVYVISKSGKPLMPTKRHGKVRRMLKSGMAKVVRRTPFTIQLLYDSEEYTQDVTVGMDIGSRHAGASAISGNKELFAGQFDMRTDIHDLMTERRMYRRDRRSYKTRYREARFLNRKKDKWLAPSVRWKVEAHIRIIHFLSKILPIARVVVEIAPFDTQKIMNPEISGVEYQNGVQKGFSDVREYCLWRAGYKSEYSGKKGILEVHHIIPKSMGGTDTPENLIVLTADEHKQIHEGKIKITKRVNQKIKGLKDASHVSTIGQFIVSGLRIRYLTEVTFGNITKGKRMASNLSKTHDTDALIIAGGDATTTRTESSFFAKFVRRQNRSLHKANMLNGGRKKVNTIKSAKGYKRFDKVLYNDEECFIYGLRTSGYFDLRKLDGSKIHVSANWKQLKKLESAKTLLIERQVNVAIPLQLT
ncbi:RNA-guided endonuclease IscB [Athalassotoga saccharophila]|uniref:RNA-guided endonuclease IscB n=1 Tax=Athalassotoga saccharophila TaxID=1441386 RepID=UPI00137B2BFE|nr:RNA-guided endonuclease IscB [Athalassotoga saccharophila]BBJ27530.1 HNH endonuclease [Athalassotoga saccharophila]